MPSKIISKKKMKWAAKAKPEMLKGTPLNYPAGVEIAYRKKLNALVAQMADQYAREIIRWMKSPTAKEWFETQDASVGSDARIITNKLAKKFQQLFNSKSKGLAESMVEQANKASGSAMHQSLKELSGGLTIKTSMVTPDMSQVMKVAIAENVSLIRSISQDYLTQVQGAVMRSISTGRGLADLEPFLAKRKEITLRRANTIALDQTRKAYNSLNEERMIKLGMDQYIWLHSGGSQVPRQHHIELNGKVCSIKNPPIIDPKTGQRGKPGDLINCLCRMQPVVSFNQGMLENDSTQN